MNMLQRNPRDPKHREFHDGEYEYWPAKTSRSGRSTGFPAACLIAAIVASALLAAALTMLYTLTSPQAIYEDSAIVNVNIYNNVENLDVRYTLSLASDPDTVLQEGVLEHSKHTLNLQGLTPGTQYILQYTVLKDGVWEPIGDFPFRTPGDPPEQSEPPLTTPTEPASVPEPTKPTEATTETTEPTTETTEATTEPEEPPKTPQPPTIWTPPQPNPTPKPAPKPTPDPTPTPTPTPTPDPEEPSGPTALEPVISSVIYSPPRESGGVQYSPTYSVQQTHRFQNIPDPYGATITIVLKDENGETTIYQYDDEEENYITHNPDYISDWLIDDDADGSLYVTITEKIDAGKASSTTVTVAWEGGKVDSTIDVPFVNEVDASLTINGDGYLELKIRANDSKYKLKFDVDLSVTYPDSSIRTEKLVMSSSEDGSYTGTSSFPFTGGNDAYAVVSAIWEDANYTGDGEYPQVFYVYLQQ